MVGAASRCAVGRSAQAKGLLIAGTGAIVLSFEGVHMSTMGLALR